MKKMVWKPEYAIHDERVDAQHLRLFDLYNEVSAVPAGSLDQERLIHDLYTYAVFHFAEEEALMATVRFPPALRVAHERSHQSFFHTLERLRSQSAETAMEFFREWLVHHIVTEDKEIGRFLESPLHPAGPSSRLH